MKNINCDEAELTRVSSSHLRIVFVFLGVLAAFSLHPANFLTSTSAASTSPMSSWHNIGSFNLTVVVLGIDLEVSPPGYPVVGNSWTIQAFFTNVSSGILRYCPLPNCTVLVYVKTDQWSRTYQLTTDENGLTTFQYLPEYTDVAFQALAGNYASQKVVFSTNFVSSTTLGEMLSINAVLSLPSAWGSLVVAKKKWKSLLRGLFMASLISFLLVTFFALYSLFWLGSSWGYPNAVIDGVITMSSMEGLTISGFVLLFISLLIKGIVGRETPEK
jgi:hypothetical protein